MAMMRIKFLATSVQMQMHLAVFLPDASLLGEAGAGASSLKVLWLLHGEGGDCTDWSRLSMVEHYAEQANIALVMPNLDNSMAMDMAHGGYPYFRYLCDDLPHHVRDLVRLLSPRREDNFVAGVASGGHGAIKWLLREPAFFTAGVCLSGDVDMVSALRRMETDGGLPDDWAAAFGGAARIEGTRDDILHLCRQSMSSEMPPPAVHLVSAVSDACHARNRRAASVLSDAGCEVVCHDLPGSGGWAAWDHALRAFIRDVVAPESRGTRVGPADAMDVRP